MVSIDPCAQGCPDHNMNSNALPSAQDDPCNTSGRGRFCVGAIWRYDPTATGANTAVNGNCVRLFIRRGADCNVAQWQEICIGRGQNPTPLRVGFNAVPPAFPGVVQTVVPYDRVIAPDPTGAIVLDPANNRFTATCPGIYEMVGSLLPVNTTYVNAGNLTGVPSFNGINQQIEFVGQIRKNGVRVSRIGMEMFREGRHFAGLNMSGAVELNTGDFFDVEFYHNHNAPLALFDNTEFNQSFKVWRDGC